MSSDDQRGAIQVSPLAAFLQVQMMAVVRRGMKRHQHYHRRQHQHQLLPGQLPSSGADSPTHTSLILLDLEVVGKHNHLVPLTKVHQALRLRDQVDGAVGAHVPEVCRCACVLVFMYA